MLASTSSLFPKGRVKPQGVPFINWDDPRTQGLVRYWLVNGSVPFDLVTGTAGTQTGSPTPQLNPMGTSSYFQGQFAATNYYIVNNGPVLGGKLNWSVVTGFACSTTPSNVTTNGTAIYAEGAVGGNDILKLNLSNGSSGTAGTVGFVYRNDAGTLINGHPTATNPCDGRFHVAAITKAGASASSNCFSYLDGQLQDSNIWNTNDNFTDANIKCAIGSDVRDATKSGFPDRIAFVALFNIPLSPAVVMSLSFDPYGFLVFPQDDIVAKLFNPANNIVSTPFYSFLQDEGRSFVYM
jgi:hypothetical protein